MDTYDEQAAIAGEAAGLRPEQWPGLAHIFRQIAAAENEACAKIADEERGGTGSYDSGYASACSNIASAIRSRRTG